MTTTVITYQLAYLPTVQVDLCQSCKERDDHDLGSLGPVQHGAHLGTCDGCRDDQLVPPTTAQAFLVVVAFVAWSMMSSCARPQVDAPLVDSMAVAVDASSADGTVVADSGAPLFDSCSASLILSSTNPEHLLLAYRLSCTMSPTDGLLQVFSGFILVGQVQIANLSCGGLNVVSMNLATVPVQPSVTLVFKNITGVPYTCFAGG